MEYRFIQALNAECLMMENQSGQVVYFDKVDFVIQLRDNLRLEFQKELKGVIQKEAALNHQNLIKYIALEKYQGELYLIRVDPQIEEISPKLPVSLEETCRNLLLVLGIMRCYHQQGITLGGLSPGQLKQDRDGKFLLQDPPVLNYLNQSLGHQYRIDIPFEVIRGRSWSEAADVFTWGALAYRLLGGADPFKANSPEDRVEKVVKANVIHLKDLQHKLSWQLSQLIMDCLNPSPNKRPTITGLIEQLILMINGGGYQVSDQAAERYAEKARLNRKKYELLEHFQLWFKKYQAGIYVSLGIVFLLLIMILSGRNKSVVTVNTPPGKVVNYYFQGIQKLDPTLVDETLYRVKQQKSFEETVVNLYVFNRGRQYMDRSLKILLPYLILN